MPKWAICRCGEGGTVSVQGAGDKSRTIGKDSRVDLDEVMVPATGDRPAQTMKDALGIYINLFELEPEVKKPSQRQQKPLADDSADNTLSNKE